MRISPDARILKDQDKAWTIVATTHNADREKRARLADLGIEVLAVDTDKDRRVDLMRLLMELGKRNISSVLVEGGAAIITSILAEQLVDRVVIIIAPKIVGKGLEAIGDLCIKSINESLRIAYRKVRRLGDDLIIDGRIEKKSPLIRNRICAANQNLSSLSRTSKEEILADKFVSERNIRFLLYEVFDATSLLKYPRYADHSREAFDMILETALKLGRDLFKPSLREMDKNQPEFVDGQVKVHPQVKEIMQICGAGGWISATAPARIGRAAASGDFGIRPHVHFLRSELCRERLSLPHRRRRPSHIFLWH